MLAISNAGFELSDSQRLQRAELNGWHTQVYSLEKARLNKAIRDAREERRRLRRLEWQIASKACQAKKETT